MKFNDTGPALGGNAQCEIQQLYLQQMAGKITYRCTGVQMTWQRKLHLASGESLSVLRGKRFLSSLFVCYCSRASKRHFAVNYYLSIAALHRPTNDFIRICCHAASAAATPYSVCQRVRALLILYTHPHSIRQVPLALGYLLPLPPRSLDVDMSIRYLQNDKKEKQNYTEAKFIVFLIICGREFWPSPFPPFLCLNVCCLETDGIVIFKHIVQVTLQPKVQYLVTAFQPFVSNVPF